MNCKPGDLAVIVRSELGMAGRLVEVLQASNSMSVELGQPFIEVDGAMWRKTDTGVVWFCRAIGAPLASSTGAVHRARPINDARLRPIRDPGEDAQDESLSWLPVPSKEIA